MIQMIQSGLNMFEPTIDQQTNNQLSINYQSTINQHRYSSNPSPQKHQKQKRQETLKEPLSKADAQARLDAALAAKVPDF